MIRVRNARLNELALLQGLHAQAAAQKNYEQLDLSRSVVLVAQDDADGTLCGMVAARLVWQVEPLILFPAFERTSGQTAKRRATYFLARAIEKFFADPTRNITPVKFFFAVIENANQRMQHLAEHIGWKRVYPKTKVFGKDV